MTGDWDGLRPQLEALGITPHVFNFTEFAANTAGGIRAGSGTAVQIAFGVDFDMGKLANIPGGTVHFQLDDRFGENTSGNYVGNLWGVQSAYGFGENFRLVSLSYAQAFAKGNIEVGFFPAGNYFGSFYELGCDFQNVAFCGHMELPFEDSGMTTFPAGTWGGAAKVKFGTSFYLDEGVFEVNPTIKLRQNGFKLNLSGSTGLVYPVELGWNPQFGYDQLPGHYKIGAFYDSSTVTEVGSSKIMESGRYGAYVMADQMLFSFEHGTNRGLIAFAQGGIGNQATSLAPYMYVFGLILQGPLSIRPSDYLSFGYARTYVNERAQVVAASATSLAQPAEVDIEADYGIRIAPWLLISPNIQYIQSPGAFSSKRLQNALVFGTQMQVNF
jgi:porin